MGDGCRRPCGPILTSGERPDAAPPVRHDELVRLLGYAYAVVGAVLVVGCSDQTSNASDIEGRVRQVTLSFPRAATRTAVRTGGNSLIESFVLKGNITVVAGGLRSSIHSAFDRVGLVYDTPSPHGPPSDINVSFTG